jgi:hypothetical protein
MAASGGSTRFNGRNMRLTDVYGELIPQIVG